MHVGTVQSRRRAQGSITNPGRSEQRPQRLRSEILDRAQRKDRAEHDNQSFGLHVGGRGPPPRPCQPLVHMR
eukprot:1658576-Pyramimonas_sp.AAC.1